jgi:hypothetical protein
LLKNNSKKEQTLKSMVLKIYSNDDNNTLLAEGYSDINKTISTNQSMPFLIKAQIDRNGNLAEYFKKDDKVRIDVYPYFATCN